MSRIPKFDAYFNMLKKVGDSIAVPAKSAIHLANNVHFYQHSKTRNKKGVCLVTRTVINKGVKEFTVICVGVDRWENEGESK